jgi:hypothetical protein
MQLPRPKPRKLGTTPTRESIDMIAPETLATVPIWPTADLTDVRFIEMARRAGVPLHAPRAPLSTLGQDLDRRGWTWRLTQVDPIGGVGDSRGPQWLATVVRPFPPPFSGEFHARHFSPDQSVALTMAAIDASLFDHAAERERRPVHQIASPAFTRGGLGYAAILALEPPELSARYGLVFENGVDDLDYYRRAAIQLAGNRWVGFMSYVRGPDPGTPVFSDASFDTGAVARLLFAELDLWGNEILWSAVESAIR